MPSFLFWYDATKIIKKIPKRHHSNHPISVDSSIVLLQFALSLSSSVQFDGYPHNELDLLLPQLEDLDRLLLLLLLLLLPPPPLCASTINILQTKSNKIKIFIRFIYQIINLIDYILDINYLKCKKYIMYFDKR